MRIFHVADLHYCHKHLECVDDALGLAWTRFTADGPADAWVIAGDSFDATMDIHQPAFSAYLGRVLTMADHAPGIVLQGTFLHDYPRSLEPLRAAALRAPHPILVADAPGIWALIDEPGGKQQWRMSHNGVEPGAKLCAICVPSLNRADPAVREAGAQGYVMQLAQWAEPVATAYRLAGIPTILVTHGTVTGCLTESQHAMVSPDHEFSLDTLEAFGADAVMLGHIHQRQAWRVLGATGHETEIAYPGSLAVLVFGRDTDTGYVEWNLPRRSGESGYRFHEVPSREMLELEYDGPPDMTEIEEYADSIARDKTVPVSVRVIWTVDQEHAARVDSRRIRALLEAAGATVKLVGKVNRVQSVRVKGIGSATTMPEKLALYLQTTGDESQLGALNERLALTMSHEPETIAGMIAERRPI